MVKTAKLDNGIVFVGEENEFVRTVSLGIWVKNGSVDETKETNGLSHFIEHMLFKGTENRTAKEIAENMSAIGGRVNAFTGKEYMCYYAHVLDYHFDEALDILSDMICNSSFNEDDIEKEKGVILEELKMSLDTPEDIINDSLQYHTFRDAKIGFNILGTEENITGFLRDSILKFYEENYISENIVISVVGKIDFDRVLEKLNSKFKSIKSNQYKSREKNAGYNRSFIMNDKDIEQTHLLLAFPSFKSNTEEMYDLSVANAIIGGGMSSKLFQRIREQEGLVYSVYSYNESFESGGLFNIYAATMPDSVEQVIELVYDEINLLLKKGISIKELKMIKEQLKSNLIIGFESMNSRMSTYGKSKLMLDRIKSQDEIITKLNKVSLESLYDTLQKLIDYKQLNVSIVGNTSQINEERIRKLCKH